MIFVTVGTHEQPFNRLVEYMDKWAETHEEDVVIQTGYSTYEPRFSKWKKIFSYQDMIKNINEARIIITHGGPSSFIMPLQIGKIPIVVPRRHIYNEHVNDHQVNFCKEVEERMGMIIVVDIENLGCTIRKYDEISQDRNISSTSNNIKFNDQLEKVVAELFNYSL